MIWLKNQITPSDWAAAMSYSFVGAKSVFLLERFDQFFHALDCTGDETKSSNNENDTVFANHDFAWPFWGSPCTDQFYHWRENQCQTRWTKCTNQRNECVQCWYNFCQWICKEEQTKLSAQAQVSHKRRICCCAMRYIQVARTKSARKKSCE